MLTVLAQGDKVLDHLLTLGGGGALGIAVCFLTLFITGRIIAKPLHDTVIKRAEDAERREAEANARNKACLDAIDKLTDQIGGLVVELRDTRRREGPK